MNSGFAGVSWTVWGIGALVIAAIFVVVVPYRPLLEHAEGLRFFIIRWGHSLVWVLLAISLFVRQSESPSIAGAANPLAALGGILYAVFMITLLTSRAG
ncbi:MAG: hypothetical protein IT320_16515 [Anaerolineae bacterium]|nr:hypothetical protein [Anaerolineae bacterium]